MINFKQEELAQELFLSLKHKFPEVSLINNPTCHLYGQAADTECENK